MKNFKICGTPCKSKYCSEKCAKKAVNEQRRKKYRKTHPQYENFYVFYDKDDFVECCGTEEQLITDKFFASVSAIRCRASRLRSGIYKGNVLVLKCPIYADD